MRACKVAAFLNVPVDIFIKLVAMRCHQIAICEFGRPVPPCQEAFIRIAKVRLRVFDDTAKRLKHFALGLDRGLDFRLPGQAEALEHGHSDTLKAAPAERLCELITGLVNRNGRVMVKAGKHAKEIRAVSDVARDW